MGRRSRARSAAGPSPAPAEPAAPPARERAARSPRPARTPRQTNPAIPGRRAITPARGTISLYLIGAVGLAGLVVVGVALLNGLLGAAIVLGVGLVGGFALRTFTERRLVGLELSEEDRTFRALATGLLLIAAALAVAALIVSLIA